MKYYAGLDVAMKETFICIVDEEGKRVFESQARTDPQPIYEELFKSGFELEKIGLETGSLSTYLTIGLQELGMNAICIDARKMAAILSVTINKTDKNDARGIADVMRSNHYKPVHIKDTQHNAIGILLKTRATLVENRTMLKNTVRGILKTYGIRLGEVGHGKFGSVVYKAFANIPNEAKLGIESILKSYQAIHEEIKKMDKALNEICKKDPEAQLLMTAPGVGMIVALTYKADLGDPSRFEKSESVGAYYGMTPRQYSSGETVRLGKVSKNGSKDVRWLLTEAGVVLLTRCKIWSPLRAWGVKLMKKVGLKKAAMAVGRKLAVIMHRMLITGESFKFTKDDVKAAA